MPGFGGKADKSLCTAQSAFDLSLRNATTEDAAFALRAAEACMRSYAEQTWGTCNGPADFDLATTGQLLKGIAPRDQLDSTVLCSIKRLLVGSFR